MDNGDGTTTVTIELEGFQEGVAMPAHLHKGTLEDYEAAPQFDVGPVEDGSSEATIEVSLEEITAEEYIVAVHESTENIANVVAAGEVTEQKGGTGQTGMPNTGAGGVAGSMNSMVPLFGFVLVALTAGALLVVRGRDI